MVLRTHRTLLITAIPFLAVLLWAAVAYAAPAEARPTPHTLEGRADCLACHDTGKLKPYPADHAGRTSATCVACHQSAPPPAAPAPAAQPGAPAQPAPAAQPATPAQPAGKNDACLACHKNPGLSLPMGDGSKVVAQVDAETFAKSIHGSKNLACTDCHSNISGYPHPKANYQSQRDFSLAMDELCQKCHADNYKKAKDGVHAQIQSDGNNKAPGCTDCHGVHNIVDPDTKPRVSQSQTCANCHKEIYGKYAQSVHGKALIGTANGDVPTCIDCHGVHNMADPRTATFRVESPDICAKCHADNDLMAKYGLSSEVVQTYKAEFHGVTAEIYKTRYPTVWCYKAVCTDCHGVHDIRKTDDPGSSVNKANLPTTCGKCHDGANVNFASAWIGHYQPSDKNSPLVYYVNLFYQIVIPLTVLSLLAFIALDIFRRVLNHVQGRER